MKIIIKLLILVTTFCIMFFSCNKDESNTLLKVTSKPERNNYDNYVEYFNRVGWDFSINITDIKNISTFIDSCNGIYNEYPIKVMNPVLVHRIENIGLKENLYEWEFFRKYILDSNNFSDEEYDKYLFSNINFSKIRVNNFQFSHYNSFHDDILEALVIRQCKLLRRHKKQNIIFPDSILNNFQKTELNYSKLPDQIAIDSLISILSGEEVNKHYYFWLLKQYDSSATKRVKYFLTNNDDISNSGRGYLLAFLLNRIKSDLNKNEQIKILNFLTSKSIYQNNFMDHRHLIAKINNKITGKNLESCEIELGIDVLKEKEAQRLYEEKQKENIENLRQQIEEKQNRRK